MPFVAQQIEARMVTRQDVLDWFGNDIRSTGSVAANHDDYLLMHRVDGVAAPSSRNRRSWSCSLVRASPRR
jgi:hypothetical protein